MSKHKKKRFSKVYESILSRFTNSGFLVGDYVKLKKGAFNHPAFENEEELKTKIKSLIDSDLNLRVVHIKNQYPAVMGANNTDYTNPFNRTIDIAQEIMPGRLYNTLSVPADVLERVDYYPNLAPVPKSMKYEDRTHIKPKPIKAANQLHPKDDINLRNKNVVLKPAPAAKATTAAYLPKK